MKKYLLILLSFILTEVIFAQSKVISLNKADKNSFDLKTSPASVDIIEVNTSLSYVSSDLKSTKSGDFIVLESDGLVKTYDLGKPNVPVFSKLIELPLEASVNFKILSYDEEIIDLYANGISQKIIPAQPSISKSQEPDKFYYDEEDYNNDRYSNTKITDFEEIGILRSVRLGRIIINPIQYNPVQNKLKILNNLKIEVEFVGSNQTKTQELKTKYSSKLFDNVLNQYIYNSKIETKQLITETITYVIIADRMFEPTLSSFISHKQNLLGYNVIVGYTDDPDVGTTTTSIKAYLEDLYDNPPSGYNPPHYILLVGDVAQIPSYSSGSHITDLYYFDYTSDNIPDVFYGRFSATNTTQLVPQIEKTLEYEKYLMPDPTYLFESVLVAGNDLFGYDLTYGNGQINYASNQYFNSDNGITDYTYLQPQSGTSYFTEIINHISNGVGYANYTAHCGPNGWWDHLNGNYWFDINDINNLTNANMCGLWVGNCCESNRFEISECFGEAALRANNKGAVGYIGASNTTLWDEDYWWGVGFKTVSTNPTYDENHLGAYDRLFHTHGESTEEWYSTQGQLVVGGNLAVEESSSSYKLYYWEIYHLMGDPSLNIRFVPPATCEENLTITENISGGLHEYLASNSITTSNTISNNANVHYGANNSITLSPGFSVELGSTFTANLIGCTDGSSNLKSATIETDTLKYLNVNSSNGLNKTEDFKEEPLIKVYPNPTSNGQFTIEILNHNSAPESVVVFNSIGSTIYKNCNLDEKIIISNITAKGVVFVKVNFDDKSIIKKLILE